MREKPTRRQILVGSLAALGWAGSLNRVWAALPETSPLEPLAGGKLLGLVPFEAAGNLNFGVLEGEGLSARRLLDLSTLSEKDRVTPIDRHFIRTQVPALMPAAEQWRVAVRTRVTDPQEFNLDQLSALAEPMGVHLMESAANGADVGFGMISAAEWTGVPITRLLEKLGYPEVSFAVLVDGYDRTLTTIPDSRAGASWIFSPEDLASTRAFLAVTMNGAPLPQIHGAPVRLVVPGWYGCTWIKWVHTVTVVPFDMVSSPHMREFGPRTHQAGRPKRVNKFVPAVIDAAAMPIRIERWKTTKGIELRIVGIRWGGGDPQDEVSIRFSPQEPWQKVSSFVPPKDLATWAFWSHRWKAKAPGSYVLEMKVGESRLRTRRLGAGHYTRRVTVTEKTLRGAAGEGE